jgi:NACHT domain
MYGNRQICLEETRKKQVQSIKDWEVHPKDKPVYWLTGTAGSGKTTIAQTFAEHSASEGRLGATFFCSNEFPDRRNIQLIFPTLAYQLAFRHPEYKDALIPIIESDSAVGHRSLEIQLDYLIIKPLKSTNLPTTIIIDALDECEDDKSISSILSLLAQRLEEIPSARFLVTGRPELFIRSAFRLPSLRLRTEVFPLYDVDQVSVDQDIELYLRTRLSEIAKQRSDLDLSIPWPTEKDIKDATKISSGLFIVAALIVRIVEDPLDHPREQLEIILTRLDNAVFTGKSGLDGIYNQVFLKCGEKNDQKNDPESFIRLRLVVGSIVLAFNPITSASLATILGISSERVHTTLRLLHSIFVVPDHATGSSKPIRRCHKSLADYLTDAKRCTDERFYINAPVLHLKLGTRCLELMTAALEKTISGLPQFAMTADISGNLRHKRREKHIDGGLNYACRWWAKHLRHASRDGDTINDVIQLLKDFFLHRLLHWLDVMKIVVGDLRHAVDLLRDVTAWLVDVSTSLCSSNLWLFIERKLAGYFIRCRPVVSYHQGERELCSSVL